VRDLASVGGGGVGGFGFGLVRNHVRTEKLCLLITMSRLGYMTICPTGKCSFVYNILWIKSRRLRIIYTYGIDIGILRYVQENAAGEIRHIMLVHAGFKYFRIWSRGRSLRTICPSKQRGNILHSSASMSYRRFCCTHVFSCNRHDCCFIGQLSFNV
jgi:hypothetical protein